MNWLEMSESEILAIANPIMDNLMQASTDIDHTRHVRDFTEKLKSIVTKENLEAQCKEYQTKLGYFAEREFAAVFRKETDAVIFWKQRYTKSNGEHIAFLRLIEDNGRILVQNVSVT
jgi:DNA-binding transcriptional regulator YiaG